MDVAKIFVNVTADTSGFDTAMAGLASTASGALKGIQASAGGVQSALASIADAARSVSSAVTSVGASAAGLATVQAGAQQAAGALGELATAAGLAEKAQSMLSSGGGNAAASAEHLAAGVERTATATDKAREGAEKLTEATGHGAEAAGKLGSVSQNAADLLTKGQEAVEGFGHALLGMVGLSEIPEGLSKAFEKLTEVLKESFDSAAKLNAINAQTAVLLASTGDAARVSAEHVGKLAEELEAHTGVSGEAVQTGENLLLMFTKVQNRTGEGKDIFDRATQAMADMSIRMGTDMPTAAKTLGAALNDPVKGLDSLGSAGATFTQGQKDLIAHLVKTGDVASAQKVILDELEQHVGGAAEAYGTTLPAAIAKVQAGIDSFGQSIVGGAVPLVIDGLNIIAAAIQKVNDTISANGGIIGTWKNYFGGPVIQSELIGVGAAITLATLPALGALGEGMLATIPAVIALGTSLAGVVLEMAPFIIAGAAVGAAAYVISQNWDAARDDLIGVWADFTAGFETVRAGVETLEGKFQEALPQIETALENLGIALTLVAGVAATGFILVLGRDALAAAIEFGVTLLAETIPATYALAEAFLAEAIPAIYAFATAFVTETIPAIYALATAFIEALPALATFAALILDGVGLAASESAAALGTACLAAVEDLGATIMSAAVPALAGLGEALIAIAIPAGLFIGLAAGIAFIAKTVYDNWDDVRFDLLQIWDSVVSGLKVLYEDFKSIWSGAGQIVSQVADWIAGKLGPLFNALPAQWRANIQAGAASLGALPSVVTTAISSVGPTMRSVGDNIQATFSGMSKTVSGFVSGAMPNMDKITSAVRAHSQSLHQAGQAADATGKALKTAGEHAHGAASGFNDTKVSMEQAKAAADALKAAFETDLMSQYQDSLVGIQNDASLMGNSFKTAQAEIALTSKALAALQAKGITSGPNVDSLKASLEVEKNIGAGNVTASNLNPEQSRAAMDSGLANIDRQADIMGPSFDKMGAQISYYQNQLNMATKGTGDASAATEDLRTRLELLQEAQARAGGNHKEASMVLAQLDGSLKNVDLQANALGSSFDAHSAKVQALRGALTDLSQSHNVTSAQIAQLRQRLIDAESPAEQFTDATAGMRRNLGELNDGVKNVGQAIGVSFSDPISGTALKVLDFGQGLSQTVTGVSDLADQLVSVFAPAVAASTTATDAAGVSNTVLANASTGVVGANGAVALSAGEVAAAHTEQGLAAIAASDGSVTLGMSNVSAAVAGGVLTESTLSASLGLDTMTASSSATNVALGGLSIGANLATLATSALGVALAIVTAPITLIVAAVAAVTVATIALLNNWDSVKSIAINIWNGIANAAVAACTFMVNNVHDAWEHILYIITFGAHQMTLWVVAQNDAAAATKAMDEAFSKLGDSIDSAFGSSLKSFLDGTKTLTDALRDGIKGAIIDGIVQAVAQKGIIEGQFGSAFRSLSDALVNKDYTTASNLIADIGKKLPEVTAQYTQLLEPLQQALQGAFTGGQPVIDEIVKKTDDAFAQQKFTAAVINAGTKSGVGSSDDISAQIKIVQDALTQLHAIKADMSKEFTGYQTQLVTLNNQLSTATDNGTAGAAKSSDSASGTTNTAASAYDDEIKNLQHKLETLDPGTTEYNHVLDQLHAADAERDKAAAPKLARGGLVTGPTAAIIGEGVDPEAVLPLNNSVFAKLASGIVSAAPAPVARASGDSRGNTSVTLQVNYTGNGKWTRDDVEGLGSMLVGHLHRLGIRPS